MMLFRTSAATLKTVLNEAKHAFNTPPRKAKEGDIILVCEKVNEAPNRKPIRWIMEYVQSYEDTQDEAQRLWGKQWNYIVECRNVRSIEAFDIRKLQITKVNYLATQTFAYVREDDEKEILRHIGEALYSSEDQRDQGVEDVQLVSQGRAQADWSNIIKELDEKYKDTPEYEEAIVRRISRPSALRDAILARDGTSCQLCGVEGFTKKDGSQYAEVHHMIELNKQAPNTLQSHNLLIVCPTCHKKLHYADVQTQFLNPGWHITIKQNP
jgi:5-methylcytosine-specific restriction enzyme A